MINKSIKESRNWCWSKDWSAKFLFSKIGYLIQKKIMFLHRKKIWKFQFFFFFTNKSLIVCVLKNVIILHQKLGQKKFFDNFGGLDTQNLYFVFFMHCLSLQQHLYVFFLNVAKMLLKKAKNAFFAFFGKTKLDFSHE